MDKSIIKYKIASALEYGLVLSTSILALFYFMLAILIAGMVILIVVAIIEPDSVPYVITLSIIDFIIIAIGLTLLIVNHKRRVKLKLWQQDAVYLKAASDAVGSYTYNLCIFIPVKATKLQLSFTYDNR